MKPVAVVGLSPSTHIDAPFTNPHWECWGLPWDAGFWIHMDRLFEMHDRSFWGGGKPCSQYEHGYLDKLQTQVDVPLYMHEPHRDIKASVRYPFEMVNRVVFGHFPRWDQEDWYNSSLAYMVALAIAMEAPKIGLWGVDMSNENNADYRHQLPNMSYLLGFAAARGIEIHIPEGPTELLRFRGDVSNTNDNPGYVRRYGLLK